MVLKREFTAEYVNRVANDPAVKHGAKIKEDVDLQDIVGDFRNFVFSYDGGCFVIISKSDADYEIHTLALKEGRGQKLREAVLEMLSYMFLQTDCERLMTVAYKDNPAAVALSEQYMNCKGETDEYKYYNLNYLDWVETSREAKAEGERFHGDVETNHEDDDTHDYHAGGALLLIKFGNIIKAKNMYNKWAKMSGYETANILSLMPLVIRLGDMFLTYHNNEVEQICLTE